MMVICPSMKGKQSLGSKIAALHLVYKTTEAQSLLFGQVVSIWPSIIKDVEATLSYEESILIVSDVGLFLSNTAFTNIASLTLGTSSSCC